jgi:hypothetical protein
VKLIPILNSNQLSQVEGSSWIFPCALCKCPPCRNASWLSQLMAAAVSNRAVLCSTLCWCRCVTHLCPRTNAAECDALSTG